MRTFMGYPREDGSVGVRNHVIIVTSVVCANPVAEEIAKKVPGIVPLLHAIGCGRGLTDLMVHTTALQNVAKSPNVAAVLVIGLGCELVSAEGIALVSSMSKRKVERIMIQEIGGSQKAIAAGVEAAQKLLDYAAGMEKKTFPIDRLTVGLECGGSDAFSGVSANPGIGAAADLMVEAGGRVILTETTEMIGTDHILSRRAATPKVSKEIKTLIAAQVEKNKIALGAFADHAISKGNQDGGLSCIQEKALGCIVKGGTTEINEVIGYGEHPKERGLVIMDGPGYDPESLTGLVASGAQVLLFSTGRGSPIGHPIAPVIKVVSNTKTFEHMNDDMDINAGQVLDGGSIDGVGEEIFDMVIDVANGEETKAERNGQSSVFCLYTQTSSV